MKARLGFCLLLSLGANVSLSACSKIRELANPEPVQLLCRFTGGYAKFSNGSSIPKKISAQYRLVLDKSNGAVYFSTSAGRKELIKATYAANHVQFPLMLFGDEHIVLVNPEELSFEMTKETEYVKSLDKGVCIKQ